MWVLSKKNKNSTHFYLSAHTTPTHVVKFQKANHLDLVGGTITKWKK